MRRPRKGRATKHQRTEAEAHNIAIAYLARGRMEDTRVYLLRGRRFAAVSTDELKKQWTAAGIAWFSHPREGRSCRIPRSGSRTRITQ
jgi:hypothetical protein